MAVAASLETETHATTDALSTDSDSLSVEVIQGALEALRKINRDRHVIDHSVPFAPEHDPPPVEKTS